MHHAKLAYFKLINTNMYIRAHIHVCFRSFSTNLFVSRVTGHLFQIKCN